MLETLGFHLIYVRIVIPTDEDTISGVSSVRVGVPTAG